MSVPMYATCHRCEHARRDHLGDDDLCVEPDCLCSRFLDGRFLDVHDCPACLYFDGDCGYPHWVATLAYGDEERGWKPIRQWQPLGLSIKSKVPARNVQLDLFGAAS